MILLRIVFHELNESSEHTYVTNENKNVSKSRHKFPYILGIIFNMQIRCYCRSVTKTNSKVTVSSILSNKTQTCRTVKRAKEQVKESSDNIFIVKIKLYRDTLLKRD